MAITIDPFSTVPIFTQLHDRIVEAVAAGELTPGTRLASVRTVAAEFGINPATVKKAYDMLQADGVVETRPREGTVIAKPGRSTAAQRAEIAEQLTTVLSLGRAQGMTVAQLRAATEAVLESFSTPAR